MRPMETIKKHFPVVILTALVSCILTMVGAWATLGADMKNDIHKMQTDIQKNTQAIELMIGHVQDDLTQTRADISELRSLVTQHLLKVGNK